MTLYETNDDVKEKFKRGDLDPGQGEIEDHGDVLRVEFPTEEGVVIFEYVLAEHGIERTADDEYVEFELKQ